MISTLNFSLFPAKELFTFGRSSIALIDSKKELVPAVRPFLTNAVNRNENFRRALERETKNPFIKNQSEKDTIRINAFMAFRNYCESASTRRKEGVPAAAEVIITIIRKHHWSIQTIGQKSRTAVITNIISEIKTKHSEELTLIGGDELLDELTESQMDFETAAHQVIEAASEASEPTVAETRPELIIALKALFQIISLQEIAAPSADVTTLIAAVNELISNSLSTVKAAGTRAENLRKSAENTAAQSEN